MLTNDEEVEELSLLTGQDVDEDAQPSYEDLLRENEALKKEVAVLKGHQAPGSSEAIFSSSAASLPPPPLPSIDHLSAAHVSRYSRQLLISAFGVKGQKALLSSSVLVIGAGGLGASALLYLAGAGVGRLGTIDHDRVEVSNLHRQIIHRECDAGRFKVDSAKDAIMALNQTIDVQIYPEALSPKNALALVLAYDLILDASDNPRTRYLISDACILAPGGPKPLISGAALGTEGQVTVYNHAGGPCYRCIYPKPLAAEASRSCSDNGVIGVVPGIIGCLQAMEAIKVLSGAGTSLSQKLLLYDALAGQFRTFGLPPRSPTCEVCGSTPTIRSLEEGEEWAVACGLRRNTEGGGAACAAPQLPDIPPEHQVSCQDYSTIRASGDPHVLLDVRHPTQFAICSLNKAINVPHTEIQKSADRVPTDVPVYVVCRRGVLSAHMTRLLLDQGRSNIHNIRGGLTEWHRTVDPDFPIY